MDLIKQFLNLFPLVDGCLQGSLEGLLLCIFQRFVQVLIARDLRILVPELGFQAFLIPLIKLDFVQRLGRIDLVIHQ